MKFFPNQLAIIENMDGCKSKTKKKKLNIVYFFSLGYVNIQGKGIKGPIIW